MDYLDRNKETRQNVFLYTGYVLVGLAILFTAYLLKNQADGYGIDRNGVVIQKGLTYFSSHPNPAKIYVNGKLNEAQTNSRVELVAGLYSIRLSREGYYDWQREIEVIGGDVQHYDYPFLFPKKFTAKSIQGYTAAPNLLTQSPDRRWVLVHSGANLRNFSLFDLKDPAKPEATLSLPVSILTKATSSETWQVSEWADDNSHVLLVHNFDGKSEYILIDRAAPQKSVNLTTTLASGQNKLSLNDKKYDKYYLYDTATKGLKKATLKNPRPSVVQDNVLAFKSYGDDTVLYITNRGTEAGKVLAKLDVGDKTYQLRKLPAGTTYVVDLAKYSGVMYAVVGAASDNRVRIYKDPVGQLDAQPKQPAASLQVLRVENVNYVSFSTNAQYIVAEKGTRFGVYDIENEQGYNFTTAIPVDGPQIHATWMDGNRLAYVSSGKLAVFDYDSTNAHSLIQMSPKYQPAFSPDYKFLYGLAPSAKAGQYEMMQASLLTPKDR